jgi:hypothetical protein
MHDNARVLHLQQAQQSRLDLFHLHIAECYGTYKVDPGSTPCEKVSIDQKKQREAETEI